VARSEAHRRSLVAAVGRTIDTARRYGARVVVVHVGRSHGAVGAAARRSAFELASRYAAGQRSTPRYRAVLDDLCALVATAEREQLTSVVDTVSALLPKCRDAGIALALETSYHPDELPSPAGMRCILDAVGADAAGAWLDTGHVGASTNLGLAPFAEWHRAVGQRWLGAHLHDVVDLRDHLPAGAGTVDFGAVLSALPASAVLTCEFDWYFDPEEVSAGRATIEAAGA
jgi:sugar phosphate isomerase/epimerase